MPGKRRPVFERQVVLWGVRELIQPSYPLPAGHRRPILVIEGGHGSGKTVLLDALAARVEQHVLHARVDFAEPQWDDISRTLSKLAGQLVRDWPRYRRLGFPRLLIGLHVINQDLSDLTFAGQREAVSQLLRQRRGSAWPQRFLRGIIGVPQPAQVELTLNGVLVQLPLNAVDALVGLAFPAFPARSRRWYGHRDRGLRDDAVGTLVDLSTWAHEWRADPDTAQGRGAGSRVAELLCEAFLADLRDCPRRVRALQTPLLLLDNVDTAAGRTFLRLLRDAVPELRRGEEPLTIVVTCNNKIPEMAEGKSALLKDGTAAPPDAPPTWLRYRLPNLTRADVQTLMDRASDHGPADRRLVRLVHEFTDGHPQAAGLLAGVAGGLPRPAASVGELLTEPVPDVDGLPQPHAEQRLLRRLLPVEEANVDAFASCAAARGRADGLWLSYQTDLVDAACAAGVREAAPWDPGGWAGAAVLRRLLLRRLAARPREHAADWSAVHQRLGDRCRQRGDTAGELYHRLAVDDLGSVAAELAGRLGEEPGPTWLELLREVARAPLAPVAGGLRPVDLYDSVLRSASATSLDTTSEQVAHLLAALRITADPACGVARTFLLTQIATALEEVARDERVQRSTDLLVALNDAASEYRQQAEWWAEGRGLAMSPVSRAEPGFANPPGRFRKPLLALAAVAALSLVTSLVVWLPPYLDCGVGSALTRQGGECVGVTDGSPAFLPTGATNLEQRFHRIQGLIKKENDRVAATEQRSVTVGMLATLTPTRESPVSPKQVLHSLEGAYTAQMRANDTAALGSASPLIQLRLANAGSRYGQWQTAVDQLVSMTDDTAPLVAVVGLSISTEDTRSAARRLSRHGVPVIASSASADGLNYGTAEGLVRVTASNTDFVKALGRYAADRDDLAEAVLVSDTNKPDLHVRTLTEAFQEELADELGENPTQTFEGTTTRADAQPALFSLAVQNVCQTGADMVLFAGRTVDLGVFVDALHYRPCRERPLSILFVETGPVTEEVRPLRDSRLTIVQASAMDPAWVRQAETGAVGDAPDGFLGFYHDFDTYVDYYVAKSAVSAAVLDGYAVANHDATATAVRAIRTAHQQDPELALTSERVVPALLQPQMENAVEVAGGTLSFTLERQGDPGGKPVPILETPAGPTRPDLYTTPAT